MPNATSKDRPRFEPSPQGQLPAPFNTAPFNTAPARATAGSSLAAPRARLVWRDPVTGEDLELEIAATPELIQSLAKAGFRPAAEPGEHEAA